jgi:hypothetical protein
MELLLLMEVSLEELDHLLVVVRELMEHEDLEQVVEELNIVVVLLMAVLVEQDKLFIDF